MIERFHHVSLSVTDLERSKHFYGEVLGLRELPRPPFDFPGAWYDLRNAQLHLIVHQHPRSLRGTTAIDSRDGHFALRIVEWEAAIARLKAHGVAFIERPDNPTPFAQIHLADPDGNGIELNVDRGTGV
jgi:glyoxylase I family protein